MPRVQLQVPRERVKTAQKARRKTTKISSKKMKKLLDVGRNNCYTIIARVRKARAYYAKKREIAQMTR